MLDLVAAGETVVITRDGKPIARMEPERTTSGSKLLASYSKRAPDQGLASDLDDAYDHMRSLPNRSGDSGS